MLEDKFHDISTSQTSVRGKSKKKTEKQKHSNGPTKSSKKLPSINFYPENWRVRTEKVDGLECFFLTLFFFSVDRAVHPRRHPDNTDTGRGQPLQDGLHLGQYRHQAPQHGKVIQSFVNIFGF